MTAGVSMAAGAGSWASVSDKNKKENFEKVSSALILDKIASLEISTWNYKSQSKSIRHIGPMAQDVYQLFSFGESDTTISTIDMDGISLSAIQELSKKTNELELKAKEIEKLQQLVAELEEQKAILEKRITGIEEKIMKKAEFTSVNK
jgi:actin-related protein